MSVAKRKLAYYTLQFRKHESVDVLDGSELISYINNLFRLIINKTFPEKKIIIETSNRFYYMADYEDDEFINIRFESAKIGHRPFLIDEETGEKRENPKGIHEGEAEISHVCLKFNDDELILLLEERMAGVTIKQIVAYFRTFISQMLPEKRYDIDYFYMQYDNFIEEMRSMSSIKSCEIYFDRTYLGSEFLNNLPFDKSTRKSVELVVKSHVRESINKNLIEKLYEKTTGDVMINRIRVEGIQQDDAKIKLDSDSFKLLQYVDAIIDEDTGIVKSLDMFTKMNDNIRKI